jgi:hypothetical protein
VSTRLHGIIMNGLTGRMGMRPASDPVADQNSGNVQKAWRFPRTRNAFVGIIRYLSTLASLELELLALRHHVTVQQPRSGVRRGAAANSRLIDVLKVSLLSNSLPFCIQQVMRYLRGQPSQDIRYRLAGSQQLC